MDRVWTRSYPEGVPHEVDLERYGTLVELLEESFAKYADRDAYILMGKSLSYGDLDRQSEAFAAYLQGLGLARGDRVAIMMPNVLQYPVALAGILRAGLIAVNINPLYTPRELEHQLKDSGSKAIVILENFGARLAAIIDQTRVQHTVITAVGDMLGPAKGTAVNLFLRRVKKVVPAFSLPGAVRFNAAVAQGAGRDLTRPTIAPDDIAALQYTGGTTGTPKGAVLLHKTIIANLLMSEAWMQPGLARRPISGQMTFVCALPLYHIYAFVTCSLLSMRTGGVNILIPNPRDLDDLVKTLKSHRFHLFPAVNTLFNALCHHPEFAKLDFSELCMSSGGGMAVQQAVAKRWLEITGCPIHEGYGLSETASAVTCNPTDRDEFNGTIGLPMSSVEVRILDDDGRPVALGERGEIAIRGPQVMSGYWQQPEETAAVMTEDGFFKSGDIGVMDDHGFVRIVDRKKDMIIVSGFSVFPNEIEGVAADHPGVLESAAVGVPDEHSGEAVKLFVIRKDAALTQDDLSTHFKAQLAGYKRPKHIEFREDLPRTNVGKILRRALRDEALQDANT